MQNNDILRRIRYIFDYSDPKMVSIFKAAGYEVTREQVSSWLKKEGEEGYKSCNDLQLANFLNGLINVRRGKRDGIEPKAEKRLTNNIILKKLQIAFNLKADELLDVLASSGVHLSKHELSAFFRKKDHKHYRECKDQVLRNFLKGMVRKYRGDKD
jgi:uncharacterized protein YehS (DUF1456 family)